MKLSLLRKLLIVVVIGLNSYYLHAQTGPGGVGNSTTNILWLRAGDLSSSLSDGASVSSWTDFSGNAITAVQGTASLRPTYNQSQINGRDVVTFDGSDGLSLNTLTHGVSNYSTFMVTNNTANSYIFETSTGRIILAHQNTSFAYYDGAVRGSNIITSGTALVNWVLDTSGGQIYVDGTQTQSSLGYTARAIGGTTVLGNGSSQFANGDIAEVVMYNTVLNSAERIIVENYLGAKYGLTIANDYFTYDTSLVGDSHGSDVSGIGRVDASNTHLTSQSSGILTLGNTSSLGDGEYLFFGHNDASIATWSTSEVPGNDVNIQRIAREWRFAETGEVGTVDITFNTADLPARTTDYDFYQLWIDDDGDFTNGATMLTLTDLGSNNYRATGVNVSDGQYLTIAIVRPELALTASVSNGLESATTPNFSVNMNYALYSNVTLDYADNLTGTASNAGTDYTFTDGTLTIPAGSTSESFSATLNNESNVENDETIIISISNPSNGQLGANTTHTFTINDDDNSRKIDFSTTSSSGAEDITPVSVTIQINIPDGSNPSTVDYTLSGTGSSTDCTLVSGTATIAAGSGTTTTISIPIIDDLIDESNETIILTLSNPTNANLGTNTVYTYTINDNDAAPSIEFLTTSSFGSEAVSPVNVVVSLSEASGQDITVNYADALSGTATPLSGGAGYDYVFTDGTLTIPAGSISGSFEIEVRDDSSEESPETIVFNLSAPSGATLGTNTSHTFTIGDNDNSGFTGPGGVGGSSNNILWLRAGDLSSSLSDGASVSSWADFSGNTITATQSTSSLQPTYNQSEIHGRDVVTFDGSDGLSLNSLTNGVSNYSTFMVTNNSANSYVFETSTGRIILAHQNTSFAYYDGAVRGSNITTSGNALVNWVLDTSGGQVYVDGTQTQSSLGYTARAIGGTTVLGNGSSQFANGDIAEVVMYNTVLNSAQRIIVENYLGAKYGLTIANEHFIYDTNLPEAIYGSDVAGIGRVDASNTHLQAQSGEMLGFNNADGLGNGEFLFLGHEQGSITAWTSTEVPDGDVNIQRIAREWRLDETGDVGNVNIELDITNLPALSAGFTNYVILSDADGDFSSGATVYPVTLAGGLYIASGINLNAGEFLSIGIIKPVVSFTTSASNDIETANPDIEISLNFPIATNVTVDYARTGGTASDQVDFIFSSGTATILAGQTTANIKPGTVNDTAIEDAETIIFDISNPSGAVLGTTSQHTYTINDDDNLRKIDFATATGNGAEGTTPVSVTIQINAAQVDAVNPTTVNYSVTNGTATGSGVDYTLVDGTATIAANTTSTTFDIAITEDLIDEEDETIIITLSSPTNANLGTNQTFTYTINDNDALPAIEFLTVSSLGSEAVSPTNIVVSLSETSGRDITVNYADALSGTATPLSGGASFDYVFTDGTLTIPAGSTSGTLELQINDDSNEESPETVVLNLSAPSGATLGTNTSHTFTINDNDNTDVTGPGGVGDNSNNILWLRAGDLSSSLADGASVSSWTDFSGNTITAIQGTGSLQPTYNQSQIHGRDVVTFDGSDGLSLSSLTNGVSNYSTFIVTNNTGNSYVFESSSGRIILAHQSSFAYFDETTTRGSGISTSGTALVNWVLDTSGGQVYVDGTQTQSSLGYTARAIGGTTVLGNGSSQFANGDIAEVVMYNTVLNSAQRIIVENYLGAKYGLTIANDHFSHDTNLPGAIYGNEVAGIGRVDASNQHTAAQSAKLLKFSNASDLGDNEYLLFGHDNADQSTLTTSEAPNAGSNTQRVAREWRVEETGDVGLVSISLDASVLPVLPSGFTDYVIWVDDDGDFSSGATQYQTSLVGSEYIASGVSIGDGNFVTMGAVRSVIEFSSATSNGSETLSNGIEISLNIPLGADITVDYDITGGTASNNAVDYNLATSGTVTIFAGETTASINPGVINDTEVESDETIIITISNPSSGAILGTQVVNTYSINDDDNLRKIDLVATSSSGSESVTPVTLTVQINNLDNTNPTTVDYAVTGGTATGGGEDFTLASGTATVNANATTTTFDIVIVDDATFENTETITIQLTNPSNANLGTNTIYTYSITDNDTAPTVQFGASSATVSEHAGTFNVEVTLSSASGEDIMIDFSDLETGTASSGGVDYAMADGTLTFTAGSTSETFSIILTDDSDIESPETINLAISNPVGGATLATPTAHTVTINDNDNTAITGPGGVGDSNTNILWLRAGDLSSSLSDGASVSSWTDFSGNTITATQGTGSLQPTYNQSQINGQDVVTFDGSDGLSLSTLTNGVSNHSTFIVTNNSANSYIFETSSGRIILAHQSSFAYFDQTTTRGSGISTSGTALVNWVLDTSGGQVYVDGTQTQSSLGYTARAIGGTTVLGNGSSQFANGDIAEVVMYNTVLNSAQRIIVENYLGVKYGLTVANDRFAFQATHAEELAGIGRVDASNEHTAAQSAKIIALSNASDLGNGEYALFAHDGGSIGAWTATESPGTGVQRVAREWRVDETGDIGTITITVDNALLPALDPSYSSYLVYIDSDGDFSAGAVGHQLALVSGSEYEVSNVAIADGDYITIAEVQNISAATGDFNDPNSWLTGSVPASGDQAIVSVGTIITMTEDHTVGSLSIEGTLTMNSHTLRLDDTGGTPLALTGTLNPGTGTIEYVGSGAQCVAGITYNNLIISGTGTKTLCGNIDVDGNLTVSSTLDTDTNNNYNVNLAGDWVSTGAFNAQAGTVVFDGTSTQNIPGAGTHTFNNVTMNKATNDLNLGAFMVVNGILTLTSGDMVLNTFDVTIGASGSISGGTASSYIQADNTGVVRKEIAVTPTSIDFQVGDDDEFSPFSFTLNSGSLSSANVTLNLRDAKQVNITDPDFITRYWTLTPSGITTPDFNVSYIYLDADIVGTESNLSPAKYDGVLENGGGIFLGENILQWDNITSFSDFTADGSGSTILPIVLIGFWADVVNDHVVLSWETASEINNDFFTIERSRNGQDFESILYLSGAGNSNSNRGYRVEDLKPLNGTSYYRLKQTDFNGEFKYSEVIRVSHNFPKSQDDFILFPNPSYGNTITLQSNSTYQPGEEVLFRFSELSGKSVMEKKIVADSNGNFKVTIDIGRNLSKGTYVVTGTSKFHYSTRVFILK